MMTADGTGGESPGQPQRDAENSQGKNIDKIKQKKKTTLFEVFEGGGKSSFLGHLEGHIKKISIPAYKPNHYGF